MDALERVSETRGCPAAGCQEQDPGRVASIASNPIQRAFVGAGPDAFVLSHATPWSRTTVVTVATGGERGAIGKKY